MKELYRFRQFLAEGVIKEEYNLPDSDSNTDKYVNNHWDIILKDILRAHTDLRNSKGGENIPERPSQLDIDIVLGRFDGADEFMDVDPSVYEDYFDFYDMYLVTQRDEENIKSISDEDYPKGNYDGYTKRDDLPKLSEGKLLKEDYESWPVEIQSLKDAGYEVEGDVDGMLNVSKGGVLISRLSPPLKKYEDVKMGKVIRYTGSTDFIDYFSNVSSNPEDRKEVKGMLRGQELLDFFSFTKYMNIDVEELESEFEDAMNYGQFTDPANVEQDKKDFTYENGDKFLDTNEDKMSEYLGFEIDTEQMIDDYFLGNPKAVEFVHSDEDFEGWMDEIGSFWR